MKFIVNVCRIGYGFAQFKVEAATAEEANAVALDEAGNFCFSESSADYEVDATMTQEAT